jgi:hypothetical protein
MVWPTLNSKLGLITLNAAVEHFDSSAAIGGHVKIVDKGWRAALYRSSDESKAHRPAEEVGAQTGGQIRYSWPEYCSNPTFRPHYDSTPMSERPGSVALALKLGECLASRLRYSYITGEHNES